MKNDFVLVVTEFAKIGSGYTSIARMLIDVLHKVLPETDIVVLGLSYRNEEHDAPARVVAVQSFHDLPVMLHNIFLSGANVRALIVALDIPLQGKIVEWLQTEKSEMAKKTRYIGIFPLEATPVDLRAVFAIENMNATFVMTEFAKQELSLHGIASNVIPLAIDTEFWRVPTASEKQKARAKYMIDDSEFVVLVVADNQERKNLSAAVIGFSQFIYGGRELERDERGYATSGVKVVENVALHIVTRVNSPYGWDFADLLLRYGVMEHVVLHERGLPADELRDLYFAADVLLSTSKAEGLGIPILEAISCGLPVIGTKCTAIEEHLTAAGGLMIPPTVTLIDPFGNGKRAIVMPDTVAAGLKMAYNDINVAHTSRQYVLEKSSPTAIETFGQQLLEAINGKAQA